MNTKLFYLYHPKHWLSWLMILILRTITLLPFKAQVRLGKLFGRYGLWQLKRRRDIARINLRLVFPDKGETEIEELLKLHFESLGVSIFESALAWWGSRREIESRMQISGLEHLDRALKSGNGVILFSAHFTNVDLSGIMLALMRPIHVVYRPDNSPVLNHIIEKGRMRNLESLITQTNIREMVRVLKSGGAVEYAMDQNFGHRGGIFSNFFNIPAATNSATSRLVKMTGATVIPFFATRCEDGSFYKLTLQPPVEMDGKEIQNETDQLNQLIEQAVRKAPEQYLWVHQRFKDRPNGEESYYQ
ncbi:MAG: LpxL/LpxP family Kdo(2)-lipid IV(A) lauroyl/palmitoleoyl acyltransferase [Thiotrichales bacterium]|mgnify:FL=1|jgi:Kdo2-lipid IVA lauroyltransferase/acyltransferase|nr:LpxL/LpxP family Kdo(2)-lipid IV(A) lauroyl/palmitoleoyl acyltransferase [Thiotrichales bacterium]MBT3614257.1 LpxL/LpxP family Kdo(2)-lipid IV(A) lauroyl/palmitoleoyl acyltransferase [Thiotrichales bacterium]MBT3752272.1 LpxL/LpxP family Kdo(2)-lipid IV(A) lauroyl/palmitoleoyl acyltransferase [Thiotrichales bacterium]MBT3837180.1 LpxL/LpxP family Kdo(2)-lipid IV(A) lauroyl/palmitoleoyl acyltransferase [Thiotrichales bacterium]MBT4152820.1 LpxL/LpxP family Kdo(2)-lipid IV(A) lauroyl/palmitol